jgi:carboxypeptidase Q
MKKIFFAFFVLPFAAMAQPADDAAMIKKISDEILRNGKAYEQLYQLTKQIGGRLAGSPAFAKAVQWGKETMEKNGADNVWLQECMVPHWVRGGADKAL